MTKRLAAAPRSRARVVWAIVAALFALSSSVVYASWATGDPNDRIPRPRGDTGRTSELASPSEPRASHCPEGFPKERLHDGTTTCGAWPGPGARECGDGEARFPGDATCRPLASECHAASDALRVPSVFPTLSAALAVAEDGDVIELAAGAWDATTPDATAHDEVRFDHAIEIRSACGADARVVGALEIGAAVHLTGIGVDGAIAVRAGSTLTLTDVRVVGPADAILVEGELVGSRLVVEGEHRAISVAGGAVVAIDRASLTGDVALAASGEGAHATLTRVALRASGEAAVLLADGAALVGDRLVIDGDGRFGVRAIGGETSLALRWAFLRTGASLGTGLELDEGAQATVETSRFDAGFVRTRVANGATLTFRDSFVASEERGSRALLVERGGHARLERVDVRSTRGTGLRVDGAFLEARDLSILATAPFAPGDEAALTARGGAHVEVWRARAERPRSHGFLAMDEGTTLALHDVSVRGAQRSECATAVTGCDGTPGGDALAVLSGAALRADHVRLEGSRGCGIVVAGAWSTLDLADARIVDNRVGLCADGAEIGALRIGAGVVADGNESSYARPAPSGEVALR